MCTREQALKILASSYMAAALVYGGALEEAYLYGSYARLDFNKESDVDILITVDDSGEAISNKRGSIAAIASNLSLEYDTTVSITVKPKERFIKYSEILPFYKNVISEGIRYAV